MSDNKMTVGQEINEYINRRGITVAELAEMVGVGTWSLTTLLSGKRKLYACEFSAICRALGEDPTVFLKPRRVTT